MIICWQEDRRQSHWSLKSWSRSPDLSACSKSMSRTAWFVTWCSHWSVRKGTARARRIADKTVLCLTNLYHCCRYTHFNVICWQMDVFFFNFHVTSCYMKYKWKRKNAKYELIKRGSYMVWEINMGVCPRLEFDNIMFIHCLGYDFYIYGTFEFSCISIANLWLHIWYHYNILGYPVIIISKVIDISWNGRRNVLLNNYIIDKFVDTIYGFVTIRIVNGHSFLWHGTPIFNCILCIQSYLEVKFLHVATFVKIPFQHINYLCMLRISRPNFMKFKDR